MTLVIVHVFYAEMWAELAACIRNVGPCDVLVTYVDEAAVEAARRDFPKARFLRCENRGYDIWPFLTALKQVDLDRYDLVVKLHTKRDIVRQNPFAMAGTSLTGSQWRDHLLAFVRTPEAVARTLGRFDDPKVGLVASCRLVFGRRESGKELFDKAQAELTARYALMPARPALFVGGTMFAVRAALLRPLVEHCPPADLFSTGGTHENDYAHLMERIFGLLVSAQGYRIAGFDGSVTLRRLGLAVRRFFYENRWSERRHSIRICGITVYLRRLEAS